MLTQLATVKARLEIAPATTTYDDLLTAAIEAVSARFDRNCGRTLARGIGATQEFGAADTEIITVRYPIETVTQFELKSSEEDGWVEQKGVSSLILQSCNVSLTSHLSLLPQALTPQIARVTYTGGYVLPGTTPGAGQTALPDDLESAAVEQVAAWFQQRDKLGLIRNWFHG